MSCNYTTYASGFLEVISLSNPCPSGCSGTGTYQFIIPITNRGDNYNPGGTFIFVGRYPLVDVSEGKSVNTLSFVPALIEHYYTWNDGRNTIDEQSKLFISIIPYDYMPPASKKGRIRFILPA